MENEYGKGTTTALEKAKIPTTGALTQPQAMHILKLVYPKAPDDEIIRCALLCRDFGLHPLMKEVYLIPFKDKGGKDNYVTVLGISATRKLVAQRGTYSYVDNTPRVMKDEEQKEIFGKVSNDEILAITKLRTKDGMEAQGYGRISKTGTFQGGDKGNTRENMAFIRSERNAFGRLFTDAIPQGIDVIDEAYADVPDVGKVDIESGEIVEGEATEIEETKTPHWAPGDEPKPKEHWCSEHNCAFELKKSRYGEFYAHKIEGGWCNETKKKDNTVPEPEPEQVSPSPEAEGPQQPKRDPDTIRTLNELFKACNEDFKLQPAQVISELGVNSQSDISDTPALCYRRIAAVR